MRRLLLSFLLAMAFLSASGAMHVQTASNHRQAVDPDWTAHLEALRPDHAMAYFELAEEVADLGTDESQRKLARQLFALAGVLDSSRLGKSACLALASMESKPHFKRRLIAMATLLGGEYPTINFLRDDSRATIEPLVALNVAEAFSFYRRGLGSRALSRLRDEESMALLRSLDSLLRGGANRFLEDCKLYKGQVRPSLSDSNLTKMLQIERALLSGHDRSWNSELLLTNGVPLIEIDTQRLDILLEVDASRSIYRAGRWVTPDA
ncbi:MAG: hypothetical protein O7G85_02855 [Planctomycetota bacterium]|nr:hypothetical protein [Planctomycetota bacterium]